MKVFKNIIAVIFIIIGVATVFSGFSYEGNKIGFFIVGAIFLLLGIFFIKLPTTKDLKKERIETLENMNIIETFHGNHQAGLPIGDVKCDIVVKKDKMIISGGGSDFNISINKLRYFNIKSSSEIFYKDGSLIAGVASALIFGAAGAILATKPKKITNETTYLIINYLNKDSKLETLLFDITEYKNELYGLTLNVEGELNKRLSKVIHLIPANLNKEVNL